MNNEIINIAIVDDNNNLRKQIHENLSEAAHIKVIFTANNGNDAINKLSKCTKLPDVILMDIEMPEMDGIEATAAITENTDTKILILTAFDTDDKIFEAVKAGAAGYLLKDSKPHQIISAIEDVMEGGAPMSPYIATRALNLLREKKDTVIDNPKPKDYNLSDREVELLQKITIGISHQQIADELYISSGTVRKHIQNIYKKLHIHNKVEAVNTVVKFKWFG